MDEATIARAIRINLALHAAVAAAAPIDGITIGDLDDRSTWTPHFRAGATDEDRAAAFAAVESFDISAVPAPPVTLSYAEMRARMTLAERQAILTACRTSWQIDDFVRLAQAEGEINLSSDTTAQAKAALIAAGLLMKDRADIILAASA